MQELNLSNILEIFKKTSFYQNRYSSLMTKFVVKRTENRILRFIAETFESQIDFEVIIKEKSILIEVIFEIEKLIEHGTIKKKKVLFVPSGGVVIEKNPVKENDDYLESMSHETFLAGDTLYRLEKCLELWKTGDYKFIILSGGIFMRNQSISAAHLMRSWLTKRRVFKDKIFPEAFSMDTFENIDKCFRILDFQNPRWKEEYELEFISQSKHLERIEIICKKYGVKIIKTPAQGEDIKQENFLFWLTKLDPLCRNPIFIINRMMRRRYSPERIFRF